MPFSFSIAFSASATLPIVTKPNPRERPLCAHTKGAELVLTRLHLQANPPRRVCE